MLEAEVVSAANVIGSAEAEETVRRSKKRRKARPTSALSY